MLAFKLIFSVLAAISFVSGILFLKNFNRIFGTDTVVPSETAGSRLLNKAQVVVLWLMAVKLFLVMAIIL